MFYRFFLTVILWLGLGMSAYAQNLKEVSDRDLGYVVRVPEDWPVEESFNLSNRRCIIYTDRSTVITVNAVLSQKLDTSTLEPVIAAFVAFSELVSKEKIRHPSGEIRTYYNRYGKTWFDLAIVPNELYTLFIVESANCQDDFYTPKLLKDASFIKAKNIGYKIWILIGGGIIALTAVWAYRKKCGSLISKTGVQK